MALIPVQKDPIRVIGDPVNINNYSEAIYYKIDGDTIPTKTYLITDAVDRDGNPVEPYEAVGFVEDKYLKYVDGAIVEMTTQEKAAADDAIAAAIAARYLGDNEDIGKQILLRTDYTQSCPDALEHGRVTVAGRAAYETWRQVVYAAMQETTEVDWSEILDNEPSAKA